MISPRLFQQVVHPAVLSQAMSLLLSLALIAALTRLLPASGYAAYSAFAAVWAIGNAIVGTGLGTSVARDVARGSKHISLKIGDLIAIFTTSLAVYCYSILAGHSILNSILGGLNMAGFIALEVVLSALLGQKRLWLYFACLVVRLGIPVALVLTASMAVDVDLATALLAVFIGNCFVFLLRVRNVRIVGTRVSSSYGVQVGIINFSLWFIAGFDKIFFEQAIEPVAAAGYALVYGLLDKGFRSLSNIVITGKLGDALGGKGARLGFKFYVATFVMAVCSVPLALLFADVISAGRYSLDAGAVCVIALGLLCMTWATPSYLELLSMDRLTLTSILSLSIAAINGVVVAGLAHDIGYFAGALGSAVCYLLWFIWCRYETKRSAARDGG